tara:strand:+ start:279 stop:503 length:225 start_codon:yes stop_codon:yes gene_type:complete
MSVFSKEYFKSQELKFEGDFCYLDEFRKLNEDEQYIEICEGLGLYGVLNIKGAPFLLIDTEGNSVEYFSYLANI